MRGSELELETSPLLNSDQLLMLSVKVEDEEELEDSKLAPSTAVSNSTAFYARDTKRLATRKPK